MVVRRQLQKRECLICSSKVSHCWHYVCSMEQEEKDWICNDCNNLLCDKPAVSSKCKYKNQRADVLDIALENIEKNLGCLVDESLEIYKSNIMLCPELKDEKELSKELELFRRWLITELKTMKFPYFSLNKKKRYAMFYDGSAVQGKGVQFLFDTLQAKKSKSNIQTGGIEELRLLIKDQCTILPTSQSFDFRILFNGNESLLDTYMHPSLVQFLGKVTQSATEKGKSHTTLYDHSKKLKLFMIACLLANAMDPRNTFLQTLIGLVCYANGLRDKGFKILNAFGIVCSIFHIRQHGTHWARLRSAVADLDIKRFWRVTFDNLDFKIKFAKKVEVRDSGCILNRMFHLLTSQVSFRKENTDCKCSSQTLANIQGLKLADLTENHFGLVSGNEQYNIFCRSVFFCMNQQHNTDMPIIITLRKFMPSWTPDKADTVVYTTIDEAYSGSIDDVGSYLVKLKSDLKLGDEGYPKYIIVGGDQQTYAHMCNLKAKYSGRFDWVYAIPGDWHIMKNTADLLKSILLNGGFTCFASKCGHKGDITQWQDIHNVLVAVYEAMLKAAMLQYCKAKSYSTAAESSAHDSLADGFWIWIKEYPNKYPQDQLSSFWCQMLMYLHAYTGFYFAVRSGNWFLRNYCLKVISELYFAYARNKYEVLSMSAIANALTYPTEVIHHFAHGQWTVSVKGRPYHNLALDEAHECIINKNLKNITTRPSHFRMIQLADFMSYLDSVISGFEGYVLVLHKFKDYEKQYDYSRTQVVFNLIKDVGLFIATADSDTKALSNAFVDSPPKLDSTNISDLLSISSIGQQRMMSYVKQYVLTPPKELQQKRKRQKLKTFSMNKPSNSKLKSEVNQTSLLLSSAYKRLVAAGPVYSRTYPFPLALCTPDGVSRSCNKSNFRECILKLFPTKSIFLTSCPILVHSITDLEIIIDFLFILHQPPPPDVTTFLALSNFVWEKIVNVSFVGRNPKKVTIVVDKPSFLPAPRALLHQSRSFKSGVLSSHDCTIQDSAQVPHGKDYQAMLANSKLKEQLISYLMTKIVQLTNTKHDYQNVQVILDYEGIESPVSLRSGNKIHVPCLSNQLGEADYGMWYHCVMSTSRHILVIGSDTDIWVYGMALKESGWLQNKSVFVERIIGTEYVDLDKLQLAVAAHPALSKIIHPLNNLAALYILSGCDYISSFFKTSKQTFLNAFIDNWSYLCEDCSLVEMKVYESLGITGLIVTNINLETWNKLVCCVYLLKHKALFQSEQIPSLHKSLVVELSPQKVRLLKCLAYKDNEIKSFHSLSEWHDFTHRVCFYHSSGSKYHESLLVPSRGALKLHLLRSFYTMKVFYSCVSKPTLFESNNPQHLTKNGWKVANDIVEVRWDEDDALKSFLGVNKCGCVGNCDGSTAGCKNCFRSCKPCTLKCKCRMTCKNPHNNGGACPKCQSPSAIVGESNSCILESTHTEEDSEGSSDSESGSDSEENELPIIACDNKDQQLFISDNESCSDVD